MVIRLVSVEAAVDPTLLGDNISYRRISIDQWTQGDARDADAAIWNNNLPLPAGASHHAPKARLLVNWGTGDTNITCREEWNSVRLITTGGYCTTAVRDWVLDRVAEHAPVGPDTAVGIVGMGRIGYTVARALAPQTGRLVYCARRPKPGLDFDPAPLRQLMASADLIIVAANTRNPLDVAGLRANRRRPFLITVSPDEALPVATVAKLVNDGVVQGIISDNRTPHGRSDLAPFYSGKVAYRSEAARRHKHWILAKELLTVQHGRPSPTVYIARHGQTVWNETGRRQGRLDSPLTAEGIAHAHRLAHFARTCGVQRVYASPLPRAVRTATIVAQTLNVQVEIVDGFVEMDFGHLQGEHLSADNRYPSFAARRMIDRLHTSYPGGESYLDLALRVQRDVDRIGASGHTSLIVGHGSVNRMMLPHLVDGLPLSVAATRQQPSHLVIGVDMGTRAEEHIHLGGDR